MWLDYKGCGILLALAILTHCFEFDLDTRNGEEMLVILLAEDFAYNMNDLGHKDRVISCMMWKKVDEITSKVMLIAITVSMRPSPTITKLPFNILLVAMCIDPTLTKRVTVQF
jgi:hypothetical protein